MDCFNFQESLTKFAITWVHSNPVRKRRTCANIRHKKNLRSERKIRAPNPSPHLGPFKHWKRAAPHSIQPGWLGRRRSYRHALLNANDLRGVSLSDQRRRAANDCPGEWSMLARPMELKKHMLRLMTWGSVERSLAILLEKSSHEFSVANQRSRTFPTGMPRPDKCHLKETAVPISQHLSMSYILQWPGTVEPPGETSECIGGPRHSTKNLYKVGWEKSVGSTVTGCHL